MHISQLNTSFTNLCHTFAFHQLCADLRIRYCVHWVTRFYTSGYHANWLLRHNWLLYWVCSFTVNETGIVCLATYFYYLESSLSSRVPVSLQESLSHSQQSANDMEHGMGNSKEGRRQLLVYTSVGVLLDMLYRFISTHIENKIQCTRLFLISNAHNAVYLWSTQIDEWAFQLAILRLFVFATKFLHCWLVQKTQDKEVRGKHCCMCKGDFISSTSSIQWQTGCSIVYLMTQRNSDLPAYFSSLLNVSVNKVNFFVLASR